MRPKQRMFGATDCGGWVKPVSDLAPERLREYLPPKLQAHPGAEAFMAGVRDSAELVATWREDLPAETPDTVRDRIRAVEAAARRMQAALAPLKRQSDAFDCMDVNAGYLLLRTREVGMPTEGRPVVPRLHTDADDLTHMLQRLHDDLGALQVLCAHTAAHVRPERSTPKHYERQLVAAAAEHYRHHFGKWPPKRSWFADAFLPYVGECIGLTIGHRIVGEVIAEKT